MPAPSSVNATTFLALLSEAEREELTSLGIRRQFPRGAGLMFEHEAAERAMIVLSGRVKVSRIADRGHEILLSIRDPGDVIGELGSIDAEPRIANVVALDDVEALVIPSQAFRSYLENTPRVAVVLLEVITRRFREATAKRSEFAASDTMGRVAARITELAARYGTPTAAGVSVDMPISQEELAAWAGASRAGTAQALQSMRELGWIATRRGGLDVLDAQALRARAAPGGGQHPAPSTPPN